MPPSAVKSVRKLIYRQYAKIIAEYSGFGKTNYGMIMRKYTQLKIGEIHWSTAVREWRPEHD